MNQFELSDATHAFEEWKKSFTGSGSAVIPLDAILEALHLNENDKALAAEMQSASAAFDRALNGASC